MLVYISLKTALTKHYENYRTYDFTTSQVEIDKDTQGKECVLHVKICYTSGLTCYTLNAYHTKSCVLVNGKELYKHFALKDCPMITAALHLENAGVLNKQIQDTPKKKQCTEKTQPAQ